MSAASAASFDALDAGATASGAHQFPEAASLT